MYIGIRQYLDWYWAIFELILSNMDIGILQCLYWFLWDILLISGDHPENFGVGILVRHHVRASEIAHKQHRGESNISQYLLWWIIEARFSKPSVSTEGMVSRKKHTKIWRNPAPLRELHKSEFTRGTTPLPSPVRAYHFFDPLSISHHTKKNDTAELVFGPNVFCPKRKIQRAELAAHRPHAGSQAGR